jgi:hypothetical protein
MPRAPVAVKKDLRDIASHVMVLAFSRMAILQVTLSKMEVSAQSPVDFAIFAYAQRVLEITFVVVFLSCTLTTVLPVMMQQQLQGQPQSDRNKSSIFTGSLVNRQLNSLTVNMQRTFAETVASIIQDEQTRCVLCRDFIPPPSIVLDGNARFIGLTCCLIMSLKLEDDCSTWALHAPDDSQRRCGGEWGSVNLVIFGHPKHRVILHALLHQK